MISELFSSLAAPVFAAVLFLFFLKSRSREINGGEASSNAVGNDGTAGGDSGAHTSTGVPEMSTSTGYDYEVFLSFRGPDTRESFTDHLCTSLKNVGIRAFKDDEDLRKGEEFAPELLQAIKQSKILVPIFSKDYASSVWCLKEVVQMVECKKTGGQKIVPIFYDVAPAEVRHQSGGYGEAFLSHENKTRPDGKKRHDQKTIGEWKAALSAVGKINAYNLQSMPNRREGAFVKEFTRAIFNELKKASLAVSDYLVGVDSHVDAIMEKIGAGTSATRIIGIHGMGGIGKTTIAKIIYNRLLENFEGCCFLSDIREMSKNKDIVCLQNQLISGILRNNFTDARNIDDGIKTIKERLSNKRVLLLFDDLYEKKHMAALMGDRDWFGKGSKLIITTRNKEALDVLGVDDYYELRGMDRDQSLKLFSKHAFRRDFPLDEYIDLSNRAIDIAGGLPLALEVIGSHLSPIKKEKWDDKLKSLEGVPPKEVRSKLKISYDALDFRQQHVFLDIACLFIGYDKDILVHFWTQKVDPNMKPEVIMENLQNLSLIKINEDNKVWMHDQLKDLGREMVREESKGNVEKQSRVWDHEQGLDLLRRHKGKTEVQALRLKLEHQSPCRFTYEDFKNLSDLRFLEVDGSTGYFHAEERLLWHESPPIVLSTNENSDLLSQLRWLSWRDFPPTFNIANFFVAGLVILNLSRSKIRDDWKGWSHMKVMKNLKVLNLSYCFELRRLPENLGRYLTKLEYLSLKACDKLETLPDSIGNLKLLIELDISETSIEELPNTIRKLNNLKRLKMWDGVISKIPDTLWSIEKLEEIEASIRTYGSDHFDVNIGNCIHKNRSLRILKLDNADIIALPMLPASLVTLELSWLNMDTFPDLSNLTNLKELVLSFHSGYSDEESDGEFARESDGEYGEFAGESNGEFAGESNGLVENLIPWWIGKLSKLEFLYLNSPYVTTSPTDLTLPPHLKSLVLDCPKLRCLPRLPSSLSSLRLESCESLCSMGDLSNLKNLSSLNIEHSAIEEIQGLGCLENLRDLKLFSIKQVKILPDLSNLNKLRSLDVSYCSDLVEIQGKLPQFLDVFRIYSCDSLQNLPDLSSMMGKQEVEIGCCGKLNVEAILGFAQFNPQRWRLWDLKQLQVLPDLSNSSKLRCLTVQACRNLVEIQGQLPPSLEELYIYSCDSLLKLPDLSSLKELQKVTLYDSKALNVEAILGSGQRSQANLWENLQYLHIWDLEQVEILPELTSLKKLRRLEVQSCNKLVEIQGELPESLEELVIDSCESLKKLPNLSSLMVTIKGRSRLNVEAISSLCKKSVQFEGENRMGQRRPESEYEGEDDEHEYESEGEDDG